MSELAALNVRITGDATGLKAAVGQADAALQGMSRTAQVAQARSTGLGGAFGRLGAVSNQTRSRIQNVGFQLQDVAIQLQAGTRASVVFAQQGSQILSVFGPVGAILGTLAAVGIPALAFAFGSAGSAAQTFGDRLDALKGQTEALKSVQDILLMGTDELRATYGQWADDVLRVAQNLAQLEAAQAASRLRENILGASEALETFTGRTAGLLRGGETVTQVLNRLQDEFGITRDEADTLYEAFNDLAYRSPTFDQQVDALNRINELMAATGIGAEKIPPALRAALIEASNLAVVAAEMANQMERGAAAAQNFTTGVPLDPNRPDLLPPGTGTGTGGRSGGGARSNPIQGQLESLRNSLMTQEEAQIASYARQQETLRAALEQRLITHQEYQALMESSQMMHSEKMAQIDAYRYGSGLQQAGAFFGDMAAAMQSGNEKMMRIGKAFGAAEALINAWRAYSQTLADPSLPFFAKFAAAAKVLAAGLGAVQAIKGGGGGGGRGGGGAATAGAADASGGGVSQNVAIQLVGGELFSRSQVVTLINKINEAVEGGAKLRIV